MPVPPPLLAAAPPVALATSIATLGTCVHEGCATNKRQFLTKKVLSGQGTNTSSNGGAWGPCAWYSVCRCLLGSEEELNTAEEANTIPLHYITKSGQARACPLGSWPLPCIQRKVKDRVRHVLVQSTFFVFVSPNSHYFHKHCNMPQADFHDCCCSDSDNCCCA
jgi:hypothetical protein